MKQTFDRCPAPNNQNEALFGFKFLLRNFRHVIWMYVPARTIKIFKKEPAFVPC
jgi:hypothetical protein